MVNGKYSETKLSCEETLLRLKDVEHLEHCEEVTLSSSQKPMSVEINVNCSVPSNNATVYTVTSRAEALQARWTQVALTLSQLQGMNAQPQHSLFVGEVTNASHLPCSLSLN